MATEHMTLRLDRETRDRLVDESRRQGRSLSDLARMLLDEGLRMQAHPGIVFRSGPGGRRPGLAAGPDVWEVVRVFAGVGAGGDDALSQTAEATGLTLREVEAAIRYYAEHRAEVDDWIQRVDEEADRAEAEWRRVQALLRR